MSKSNAFQSLVHQRLENARTQNLAYTLGRQSYIPGLIPEMAVQLGVRETLGILRDRFGIDSLIQALNSSFTQESPIAKLQDTEWIKRSNTVGVNVRTLDNFFNVIKYALSLPASQANIHLLPIWEPGVVKSLYGMASWQINSEFFSRELLLFLPHINTVEKQLKVTTNLLHLMGKTVGMDVIPHTDRYSEIVLANPSYFEWLIRKGKKISNHRANLHEDAEKAILEWLGSYGSGQEYLLYPSEPKRFFSESFPESKRILALFGQNHEYGKRNARRASLLDYLFKKGLEPVPATMAPPYRGLEVDPKPSAMTKDDAGRVWRDYRITKPEGMSRVFGPLTRYKIYDRKDDNKNWEIDFSKPRPEVWQYFCDRYQNVRDAYNFDFMRGDMSHVQMRPNGVPEQLDNYYDPLRAVRNQIRKTLPSFAYFAESFLAPANTMAYGDEADHLEASGADSTLGDLQSMVVGSKEFMQAFAKYVDLLQSRSFAPNFTMITGDKDDPRFDRFYLKGNEIRLFIALFLTDMPTYMSLGFAQRDPHPKPAPNEHYTKLYVFHLEEGPKATAGPYQWGKNASLFTNLSRIRHLAEALGSELTESTTDWIHLPDASGKRKVIAWTQKEDPNYLFLANLDLEQKSPILDLAGQTLFPVGTTFKFLFSTKSSYQEDLNKELPLDSLHPGEGRCYKIIASNSL